MSSQWNSQNIGKNIDALQSGLLDEEGVILMQGKNTFGDRIYSYLKLSVRDLMRMQEAIKAGEPFNPSEFGSVVAAGKGEPTSEIHGEITSTYKYIDPRSQVSAMPEKPPEPKAWDDF